MPVFARRYPIPFWNDQSDKCRGVGNFATKLVAMATSLKVSEKEGWIDHLPFNIYHMVQKL